MTTETDIFDISAYTPQQIRDAERRIANTVFEREIMPNLAHCDFSPWGNSLVRKAEVRPSRERVSELLDEDMLFRFGYVPFVIAAVAWDYADSLINLAIVQRHKETRRISREVRELKRDYDIMRQGYIDNAHERGEQDNMILFQEELSDVFNPLARDINTEIKRAFPDIDEQQLTIVCAVYMCRVVLDALFRYAQDIESEVAKIIGFQPGHIVPKHMHRLYSLVMDYAGDNRLSSEFVKSLAHYVSTLVNEIKSIEFTKDTLQDTAASQETTSDNQQQIQPTKQSSMATWYEAKVSYEKTTDTGAVKRITEPYIIDALSCTEAEARVIDKVTPYVSGDLRVSSVKRANFAEIIPTPGEDLWYKVKLNFISIDDKTGAEKRNSSYMLIQASNFGNAYASVLTAMKDTIADYEIASITETSIVDVLVAEHAPETDTH